MSEYHLGRGDTAPAISDLTQSPRARQVPRSIDRIDDTRENEISPPMSDELLQGYVAIKKSRYPHKYIRKNIEDRQERPLPRHQTPLKPLTFYNNPPPQAQSPTLTSYQPHPSPSPYLQSDLEYCSS
jgi:hypothetical protein